MKKKRNSLLILAERHVKCESRLLAHVESSGMNSLVYRKVLSAVIRPRLFHLCDSIVLLRMIVMFVNDFVSEIFPAFKSLKFKAVINSPSLCLHVKRVTTAL